MRVSWLILCLFLPLATLAQNAVITGKVTRADTKAPLGLANVFLSNTTAGTATADDGTYALRNLKPGQYTLIVSIIGYEDFSKSIFVGNEPIKLDVELSPKTIQLRDVVITTPANWKKNYDQFVKDFIGTDENAKFCFVKNPHEVNLEYHKAQQMLEAFTNTFLIVDNLALGYRVKFLLNEFTSSKLTGIISNEGPRLFEELPGTKKQKEEWRVKREQAYYGSAMHFYRALYTNKLDQEGFQMMKLTRMLNPNRAQEGLIQKKIKFFNDGHHRDSIMYWIDQENMSKYFRENLERTPMASNAVLFNTEKSGIFAVDFTDCLYVVYTKKREDTDFKDVYRPLDMPNYELSIATISHPYFFDTNGIVFGNSAPLYEGTWSKSRLSDLLPFDYAPEDAPPELAPEKF
jgi:hypothetical protein